MKKDLIRFQNRESEFLRSQEETALLFQQTQDELKGVRAENRELRMKLSKYEDKDTLDRNRLFGRQTEKTKDLISGSTNSDENKDPLSEDADPEAEAEGSIGTECSKETRPSNSAGKTKKAGGGKKSVGKHKKDLCKLPQQAVYDYHPDELDKQYGEGNWRVVSWHASTKKEVIPAVVYVKTTYTPVISVGLAHEMISVAPSEKTFCRDLM